ncbi:DNA repair and recombination protein RadB [Candidatus Woesearchaeota archaeon]|nr:MAG: DNA repair and recombination protein RadB [Candidatus Woesearchaeota archaeon]
MEDGSVKETERIDSGAECINRLLKGGYEKGIITTIYGSGGSGKTNLCLLATAAVARSGKKVVYADTEGNFSMERFKQIAPDYKKLLDKIIVIKITDFEQQKSVFDRIDQIISDDTGLFVIDSVASLYRIERDDNPDEVTEINRDLGRQLYKISKTARTKEIPVLVTNQVWQSFEDNSMRMVGGNLLRYSSKCIIELGRTGKGRRRAVLKKHRSLPEESEVEFMIVSEGIKTLSRQEEKA